MSVTKGFSVHAAEKFLKCSSSLDECFIRSGEGYCSKEPCNECYKEGDLFVL